MNYMTLFFTTNNYGDAAAAKTPCYDFAIFLKEWAD